MEHLHYPVNIGAGSVVEVTLDHAANVMLLDDMNYRSYVNGQQYRYYGGHATQTPVRLLAPYPGQWHVVVDLGGHGGSVRASVRVGNF